MSNTQPFNVEIVQDLKRRYVEHVPSTPSALAIDAIVDMLSDAVESQDRCLQLIHLIRNIAELGEKVIALNI